MSNFAAVFDACVLYPAPLRDLLMRLALTDLFRAKWSEDIHQEWMTSLAAKRPDLSREKIERTRSLMDENVRDCLVHGYQPLIAGLSLPDPNDRHVLAAAISCGASVIVTFNVKDFPADCLKEFGIEPQHPDDFITHLIDLSAPTVCAAAKQQRASLRNPVKSVAEYLDALGRSELVETCVRLSEYKELL